MLNVVNEIFFDVISVIPHSTLLFKNKKFITSIEHDEMHVVCSGRDATKNMRH